MKVIRLIAVSFLALVASAQAPKPPPLPRIDRNACPFECCQFGHWTANRRVAVYDGWQRNRKHLLNVEKGDVVTAITGVHITYKPGHLRALKPIPELKIQSGDTVLTYAYHGEGYFDFWADGHEGNDQVYTALRCSQVRGNETEPFCVIDQGEKEWWVQIKTRADKNGWVKGNFGFDGTDACA